MDTYSWVQYTSDQAHNACMGRTDYAAMAKRDRTGYVTMAKSDPPSAHSAYTAGYLYKPYQPSWMATWGRPSVLQYQPSPAGKPEKASNLKPKLNNSDYLEHSDYYFGDLSKNGSMNVGRTILKRALSVNSSASGMSKGMDDWSDVDSVANENDETYEDDYKAEVEVEEEDWEVVPAMVKSPSESFDSGVSFSYKDALQTYAQTNIKFSGLTSPLTFKFGETAKVERGVESSRWASERNAELLADEGWAHKNQKGGKVQKQYKGEGRTQKR